MGTFFNMHRLVVLFLCYGAYYVQANNCSHRSYGYDSTVCVCNVTHCDKIESLGTLKKGSYVVYSSSRSGKRFYKTEGVLNSGTNNGYDTVVKLNHHRRYQSILGFGGAFTDAVGITIKSLNNSNLSSEVIKSYYGPNSIEYTFGRVPIAGTDFSVRPYTYDDNNPGDDTLEKFSLQPEDYQYKIPILQQASSLTKGLKLIGAAWTAPAWMKTNDNITGIGFVKPDYYQTWADYHVKFLEAYVRHGINFWALTTGNEPTIAFVAPNIPIPSTAWTFDSMQTWVNENFGPTLKEKYPHLKLFMLDDQRYLLPFLPIQFLRNRKSNSYIDGIAFHWYYNDYFPADALTELHKALPRKYILSTEAAIMTTPKLGNWETGERYAEDIMQDLQNWANGWIDWNLCVNDTGGPTYISNLLDAPIIINSTSQEFYKQPMYYVMGQFSKFIVPDSVRIDATFNNTMVQVVAFTRPDRRTAVVIYNSGLQDYKVLIKDQKNQNIVVNSEKKSIITVVY